MSHEVLGRILLVEDDSSVLFAVSAYFRLKSFEVSAASSLGEARDLLERKEFDVVITDLRLTSSDANEGLEVIARSRELHPRIGTVVLTAYASAETIARAESLGVDAVLSKPADMRALHDRILPLIARSRG